MAVTHPTAGNIGGGGFLVFRSATGEATTFDFREAAPAGSNPEMWLVNGKYDTQLHHNSHRAVGVPGTVAGLHLAWKTLRQQAVEGSRGAGRQAGARRVRAERWSGALARAHAQPSSRNTRRRSRSSRRTALPYQAGEIFKQPDLARTLQRIADQGPAGFYEGETAALIEKEMKANGGLITREDLKNYQAKQRAPIKGTYRGYDIIGMAPPSSGGIAVQLMLNILEGYDLKANGAGSAQNIHYIAEVDATRVCRSRAAPGRSRLRQEHADRSTDLEGLCRATAQDDQSLAGLEVVADARSRGRPSPTKPRTSRSSMRSATPWR